ncbi:MAG: HAD family hydrolase [Frankiaceae bacterium]
MRPGPCPPVALPAEPPPLRGVLFDAGDTLIRLRGERGALVRSAAEDLGRSLDPGDAEQLWTRVLARAGTPEELSKGRDLSCHRHRRTWTRLYRSAGADSLLPGLSDAMYQRTIAPTSWEPFPDTLPVLAWLCARGIRIGIVSDTGFDFRPAFDAVGITPLLTAVVLSFECGACKPASSVFELGCRLLGTSPEQTLMVGDSWLTDAGAVAAGLPVLLLPATAADAPRGLSRVQALLSRKAPPTDR